jgi:hypothetical protein
MLYVDTAGSAGSPGAGSRRRRAGRGLRCDGDWGSVSSHPWHGEQPRGHEQGPARRCASRPERAPVTVRTPHAAAARSLRRPRGRPAPAGLAAPSGHAMAGPAPVLARARRNAAWPRRTYGVPWRIWRATRRPSARPRSSTVTGCRAAKHGRHSTTGSTETCPASPWRARALTSALPRRAPACGGHRCRTVDERRRRFGSTSPRTRPRCHHPAHGPADRARSRWSGRGRTSSCPVARVTRSTRVAVLDDPVAPRGATRRAALARGQPADDSAARHRAPGDAPLRSGGPAGSVPVSRYVPAGDRPGARRGGRLGGPVVGPREASRNDRGAVRSRRTHRRREQHRRAYRDREHGGCCDRAARRPASGRQGTSVVVRGWLHADARGLGLGALRASACWASRLIVDLPGGVWGLDATRVAGGSAWLRSSCGQSP